MAYKILLFKKLHAIYIKLTIITIYMKNYFIHTMIKKYNTPY